MEALSFDLNFDVQRLLTAKEVARWLAISEEAVDQKAAAGEIPGVQVTGAWKFGVASLNLWVEGRSLEEAVLAMAERTEISGDAGRLSFQLECLITLDELEQAYINHVLKVHAGNKTEVAQVLGVNASTLYRKLNRL